MISAYCWPQSASGSESVELFVDSPASDVEMTISRQGLVERQVLSRRLQVSPQTTGPDVATRGCNWAPVASFRVESAWPSGMYLVRLKSGDAEAQAFFVVRGKGTADAMLVLSTSTWAAYNNWGGPSFYTGGHEVSLDRPLPGGFLAKDDPHRFRIGRFMDFEQQDFAEFAKQGYSQWCMAAGWANWEMLFVRWAEREGLALDYAISQDLDGSACLLAPYKLYVSVGHDEYWSAGMRDQVESYVEEGGHAAFFSGNTSFWQVRFDSGYRKMIGYKMRLTADPAYNDEGAPALSTMWSDPLVGRPENEMTGVSFTRGGYAHMPNSPRGTGGYHVERPDHWALDGLSLARGDDLGSVGLVVAYECDGCAMTEVSGQMSPDGSDGTPLGFEIVATAPARLWETHEVPGVLDDSYVGELNWVAERLGGEDSEDNRLHYANGHAVMGSFRRGKGEVFTTGCTDWAYGLETPDVARVTNNVVKRMLR